MQLFFLINIAELLLCQITVSITMIHFHNFFYYTQSLLKLDDLTETLKEYCFLHNAQFTQFSSE